MNLKPLHTYLIVKVKKENQTKSGILIANAKPSEEAKVVKVAKEVTDIKVGDNVLFSKYAPLEVTVGDEKISLIDYSDIYAIILDK